MNATRGSQAGNTLLVAILLLLLLSVVTFFVVKMGLSEQRGTTSDSRAKVAHRVAEAGLNQAVEFVRMRRATILPAPGVAPDSGTWTACAATDRTFPCGAIDSNTASSVFRSLHYAYTAGVSDGRAASDAAVDARSLPLTQSFTSVGNFPVTYSVGAVLCLMDKTSIGLGKTATCTIDAAKSNTVSVTLVSTGQIDGESARATITETLGQYRIINSPPGLPPVVASSVIEGLGNGTIVASPNSGSATYPISAWTRSTIGGDCAFGSDPKGCGPTGSFQTCERGEYFGTPGADTTRHSNGALTCTNCACVSGSVESTKDNEGRDMLDRDDDDDGIRKGVNSVLSPTYKFPCDLFGYAFGVTARKNDVQTDMYADAPPLCETQTDANSDGVADVEEFLTNTNNFTQVGNNCDSLVDTTSGGGFFYASGGCSFSGSGEVGSPTKPVIIVADCSFKNTGPTIYGLVFVRDPSAVYGTGKKMDGSNVSNKCVSDSDKVGAATYEAGGGTATIFGAVIIEGKGKLNGGLNIVASPEILDSIVNDDRNLKFARVPGTWSDRLSY